MNKLSKTLSAAAGLAIMAAVVLSCKSTNAYQRHAVRDFQIEKYLGKWFEIARMDEFFERGLEKTSAHYSLNQDGTITVINRGYSPKSDKWKESKGVAKPAGEVNIASLQVAFFKPFWAGYNVVAIDDQYENALITGDNAKHLWILSRTPTMDPAVKQQFLQKAQQLGFSTDKLIWVKH